MRAVISALASGLVLLAMALALALAHGHGRIAHLAHAALELGPAMARPAAVDGEEPPLAHKPVLVAKAMGIAKRVPDLRGGLPGREPPALILQGRRHAFHVAARDHPGPHGPWHMHIYTHNACHTAHKQPHK